jgi:hypothetical protein
MRRISLVIVVVAALGLLTSCRPYVILASGDDCSTNLAVEGQLEVSGRVHSNGDLSLGDQGTVNGTVTATGDAQVAPDVSLNPVENNPQTGVAADPYQPAAIADYRPGGEVALLAAGQGAYYDFTGQDINPATLAAAGLDPMPPGIYYTDGNIDLGYAEATLVAEGKITLSDNGASWLQDPNQVLALSGYDGACGDAGVTLTSECLFFTGRVLAPSSGVAIDAESMVVGETQIVADWVQLSAYPLTLGPLPKAGASRNISIGCPATPPL